MNASCWHECGHYAGDERNAPSATDGSCDSSGQPVKQAVCGLNKGRGLNCYVIQPLLKSERSSLWNFDHV